MSGVGMVLNIAKSALLVQQRGMDVTAHNIANVSTPGYSKQSPVSSARTPSLINGMQMGTGSETTQIVRSVNAFIENQLMKEKSSMGSAAEMENYMRVLEELFAENTDSSLNTMLSEFWNLWNDLSNNPAGYSERIALHEYSLHLSERFNDLSTELVQLQTDITNALGDGIHQVNQLAEKVAVLNGRIIEMETGIAANDVRDQRDAVLSELSKMIDVDVFTQKNGSVTVVTAKGCVLVQDVYSYAIKLGGANGDSVLWQGSGAAGIDITDQIAGGKLGGWLNMRDEILAKTQMDFDAMASELIWSVNQLHSQGVGLKLFDSGRPLTGSYQTGTRLGELHYGDRIQFVADAFNLWIEDRTDPDNPVMAAVSIDLSSLTENASLSDLATLINDAVIAGGLTGVTADGSGTRLSFSAGSDHAFGFSGDQSNLLAALGINTFFQGSGAGSIDVNEALNEKDYIAAARIDATGNYAAGDNRNALAMADLQFRPVEIATWTCSRKTGNTAGSFTSTIEGYYQSMSGFIGITASRIYSGKADTETMVNNLAGLRDSVSAVSLDEEMTNLIQYQHAYAAAAKLISVADELLQTLLDLK